MYIARVYYGDSAQTKVYGDSAQTKVHDDSAQTKVHDDSAQTKVYATCSVSAKASSSEARRLLIDTSLPPNSRIRASVWSISLSSRSTRRTPLGVASADSKEGIVSENRKSCD